MSHSLPLRRVSGLARAAGVLALVTPLALPAPARVAAARVLTGHIPPAVATAQVTGRLAATKKLTLALTLPLRNQADLDDLLAGLYNPQDSRFHKYLTPQEFTDRFAPKPADYGALIAFAQKSGLTVTAAHSNRTLLDVSGSAAVVEKTFGVHLMQYKSADGRVFYAPDREPSVSAALKAPLAGIIGLDNAAVFHPHSRVLQPSAVLPHAGTGPGGGLAPSDIKTAYGLSGVTQNGSGQTLGLFELDGYTASDITHYESQFGLPSVPLTNVKIDGATGSAGSGAGEVTLDIELQIALAPHATKILVYEAPNTDAGRRRHLQQDRDRQPRQRDQHLLGLGRAFGNSTSSPQQREHGLPADGGAGTVDLRGGGRQRRVRRRSAA